MNVYAGKAFKEVALEKKRVLIVDDDVDLLQLMTVLLSRINVAPIAVETASRAAEVLKQQPLPDLVILDLMLPDVSGIDFLKQMRIRKTFDELPVLVLSALVDPDHIREALNAGADRYLTKPYIANNLITVVQEILRTGRKTA